MLVKKSKAKRAAKRLPRHLQHVAFTKYDYKADQKRKARGTFGPASEVRHIDPKDYKP